MHVFVCVYTPDLSWIISVSSTIQITSSCQPSHHFFRNGFKIGIYSYCSLFGELNSQWGMQVSTQDTFKLHYEK